MGRILFRYLFREVTTPFFLGLVIFTFILLAARILKLVEMVVNRGVPALQMLQIFLYVTPAFFEVTVPMALAYINLLPPWGYARLSSSSAHFSLLSLFDRGAILH
jgi:lipopolysaccharide export system permease protein